MTIFNHFLLRSFKTLSNAILDRVTGRWHNAVIDLTNYCNLRCPFCFNDWSQKYSNTNMKIDYFNKIVKIFPLINNQIYLSCNYEPTLHPNLIDLIKLIPFKYREKCFFTTNLSIKLTDDTIHELSKSGLNHINISLDSFNPIVYESFRKGCKFEVFHSNLQRISKIFSKNINSPKLNFITMVFKQNIDEIPLILEKCNKEFNSSLNEFRSADFVNSNHWYRQFEITQIEWQKLKRKLACSSYKYKILRFEEKKTRYLFSFISFFKLHHNLNITADGQIYYKNKNININQIENPFLFFKKER